MKQKFYKVFAAGLILLGTGSIVAQTNRISLRPTVQANVKATKLPNPARFSQEFTGIPYLTPNPTTSSFNNAAPRAFGPEVKIGQTLYDLQTNSSIPQRIINHGDGTLSTTWTFSAEAGTPWADRGMAYHYFNGTAWVNLPDYENASAITRVEGTTRTGFGSIGRINGVGDIIVAHNAGTPSQALVVSRNPNLDETQNWISSVETEMSLIWPRMAVGGPDGKTVHVIGLTEPTGGTFTGTPFNGINGALLYNRSTDGGQSFDQTMIQLPGVDSSIFEGFSGDAYAIDARGNTVAFVSGESNSRVMLWKSTDNGTTWDTTTVLSFPYEPWNDQITDLDGDGDADSILVGQVIQYDTLSSTTTYEYVTAIDSTISDSTLTYILDTNQVIIDSFYVYEYVYDTTVVDSIATTVYDINETIIEPGTFETESITVADGNFAIVIDNNNRVHVWFGAMNMQNSAVEAEQSYSYFPGTSGILYWNEGLETDSLILAADVVDDNADGTIDVTVGYPNDGPVPYNSGLTTFPSAGIDAAGTLYLSYAGSKEGADYRPVGPNYKHIYLTKSDDNGSTWIAPVDLVGSEIDGFDQFAEYTYGAIAKLVDENVHLIYQRDGFPGSAVTIDDGAVHPNGSENDIIYLSVPNNFEQVGLKKVSASTIDANLLPNPANEATKLTFQLEQTENVTINITNLLGQNVETVAANTFAKGSNSVAVNTQNLPSGIYLVNITAGESNSTLKLVVKH
jgi:hypothetical protein